MNKLTADRCRDRIASLKRNRRVFGLAMDSELYLKALEIALPVLEQQRGWVHIRFKDRSKNQCMKCNLAFNDGFNSFLYDEEGNPFIAANSSFEFINEPTSTKPNFGNDGGQKC